jgi:hypothetical protein
MAKTDSLPLYLQKRAHEAKKRKNLETRVGMVIAVGLIALGSWGMWNHNLFLTIPFAFLMLLEVVQARKVSVATVAVMWLYGSLVTFGMWNQLPLVAAVGYIMFVVGYFLEKNHK